VRRKGGAVISCTVDGIILYVNDGIRIVVLGDDDENDCGDDNEDDDEPTK
jgi:hypothetical protein